MDLPKVQCKKCGQLVSITDSHCSACGKILPKRIWKTPGRFRKKCSCGKYVFHRYRQCPLCGYTFYETTKEKMVNIQEAAKKVHDLGGLFKVKQMFRTQKRFYEHREDLGGDLASIGRMIEAVKKVGGIANLKRMVEKELHLTEVIGRNPQKIIETLISIKEDLETSMKSV